MNLSMLTTSYIKQHIIATDADIQYWEEKLFNAKTFTRRNYYRNKITTLKYMNEQARAELALRNKTNNYE